MKRDNQNVKMEFGRTTEFITPKHTIDAYPVPHQNRGFGHLLICRFYGNPIE